MNSFDEGKLEQILEPTDFANRRSEIDPAINDVIEKMTAQLFKDTEVRLNLAGDRASKREQRKRAQRPERDTGRGRIDYDEWDGELEDEDGEPENDG